jgi:hypothetical protein
MTDENREDLKTTAANVDQDAASLKDIERRKRDLGLGHDEESNELAGQAGRLADDIAHEARAQQDLADKLREPS